MNKLRIIEKLRNAESLRCKLPGRNKFLSCRVCNEIVDKREYQEYDTVLDASEDIDLAYYVKQSGDFVYILCSIACKQMLELNPLAYEENS